MAVVTIRGQLGSGAPEIGRILAEKLGYSFYDQAILSGVAAKSERSEECIAGKEMPAGTLAGKIIESINSSYPAGMAREGAYLPGWEIPLEDKQYFELLKEVILEIAGKGNAVIRGRGSQFILKDYPNTFHILTVAPLDVRLSRMQAVLGVDAENAAKAITNFDKSRHQFIKKYFNADIENPVFYNLVINTRKLSYESAAALAIYHLQIEEKEWSFKL